MITKSDIEISRLLLQDDKEKIEEILHYIDNSGVKVRKIKTVPFMMSSVLYEKNDGLWDIHLYNYTRHKQIAFPYIYLSLASILRREKIWFKTINPINLDEINNRILVDHFSDKIEIKGAVDFRQEYLQGLYLGFEIFYLLTNNKITNDEALSLFYDCDNVASKLDFVPL